MARAELVSKTSYAYLGTLARLDRNGDGVLSRSERAADEKPGLLKQINEDNGRDSSRGTKVSDGVLAYMLESGASEEGGMVENSDLYASTYGQYDTDYLA